jgi:DNA transposition AAA+ family ATPase
MSIANGPQGALKLDDLTLEKQAAGYPEEMREPFNWLGWYVREKCHRDLDVLTSKLKAFGIAHDKTTWSKILRGRWNKDSNDKILAVPILALPKFLKVVEMLREDQELEERAGKVPFVATSTTKLIFDFLDTLRAPERINKFGVVVGYTGSQKTASFKEYQLRHNHGLCTWQESPENGSVKEFVLTLGAKYGGGFSDSYECARQRIFRTVKNKQTIIVDNAQSLYKPKMGNDQQVFNLLRRLNDERGCAVVLSITPEFHKKLVNEMLQGYFEQFEGRAGGRRNFLELPEFPPEEDVLAIAEAFKLKEAEKHLAYLSKIAREPGRVRRLFGDLQDAKVVAESEEKPLTISHVRVIRGEED